VTAGNDGATGLGNLDYTVAQAGKLGLKLVIPFTGNWGDFGGEDQYVAWAGGSYHDDFYTNATIKAWYKAWISHLLNHVNSITGVAYRPSDSKVTSVQHTGTDAETAPRRDEAWPRPRRTRATNGPRPDATDARGATR